MFLVAGDDPETNVIEGAHDGDEIIFKIHLPTGELFPSDTRGIWEEAVNHQLNLYALSDIDSLKTPLTIKIRVNDQYAFQDIVSGDPIPADATIFIDILSDVIPLQEDDVTLELNQKKLSQDKFSISSIANTSKTNFEISLPVRNLQAGYHHLKVTVQNGGLFPNERHSEFAFRTSNNLELEKIVNFPNPMAETTKFTYILLNKQEAEVTIKIYTVAGRLIRTIHGAAGQVGYNETFWDGTDEFGDPIANGVYFYKIIAKDSNKKIERVEKLIKIE